MAHAHHQSTSTHREVQGSDGAEHLLVHLVEVGHQVHPQIGALGGGEELGVDLFIYTYVSIFAMGLYVDCEPLNGEWGYGRSGLT